MTGSHEVDGSIPFSSTKPLVATPVLTHIRALCARRLLAGLLGVVSLLASGSAGAFPNSKARLQLHLTRPDLTASCGDLDASTLSPSDLTLHGVGGPWLLWVLVSDTQGLSGVSFSVDADPGVKILSWQSCGDYQFPVVPWPQSGGANSVVWKDCAAPTNGLVTVGFLLLDEGSVGTVRIERHTQFNEIQLVDCALHVDAVPESCAAAAAVWPDSSSYQHVGLVWRTAQERPEPAEPDSVVLARERAERERKLLEENRGLDVGGHDSSAAPEAADTLRVPDNER